MALVTRELNNTGAPLYGPDGTLLVGATVTFALVGQNGTPRDVWDATTNERISGSESATTDESGEFSVNLWPNDRGDSATYYSCTVSGSFGSWTTLQRQVPSGAGAYTWVEFYAAGDPLSPTELSILEAHIAAEAVHGISADEHAAIDGAAGPSAANVFATMADVGGGGGLSWSVVSTNTNAANGNGYLVDSSSGPITVTAPPTPTEGQAFGVICLGSSETNAITINRNGENIEGSAANKTIATNRYGFTMVYSNATHGWVRVHELNTVQWTES